MPKSKRSIIHHFVPQTIQRRFTIRPDSEQIWYSERDEYGRYITPELRNIRSTFKKKNFYTITHQGQKSDIIEREFYGHLDNAIGKFISDMRAVFDRGAIPVLSGEALASVRHMIMEMTKRTPHFVKSYDEETVGRQAITKLLDEEILNLSNSDISQMHDDLQNTDLLKQVGKEARVRAAVGKMEKTEPLLEEFSIRWLTCSPKSSFILTDMGAFSIGGGLSSLTAQVWMPMAPQLFAVMVRDPENKIPLLSQYDPKGVRDLNSRLVEEASAIASPSLKLLEALICRSKSQ